MTRTYMLRTDYLGEMKRCFHCKKLKDVAQFNKSGIRLHAWCKTCCSVLDKARRKKVKDENLAEEKIKKAKQAIFRKEILNQPSFIYQNGYTLNVIPMHENFKIEICDEHEEMAVPLPADRAELLRDWLNVKLKQEKE